MNSLPCVRNYLIKFENKSYYITIFINENKKYQIHIKLSRDNYHKEFKTKEWIEMQSDFMNIYEHINDYNEVLDILDSFVIFECKYLMIHIGKHDSGEIYRINLALSEETFSESNYKVMKFNEEHNRKHPNNAIYYRSEVWLYFDEQKFQTYHVKFYISKLSGFRPDIANFSHDHLNAFELTDKLYTGRDEYLDENREFCDQLRLKLVDICKPTLIKILMEAEILPNPLCKIISEYCFYYIVD